MTVKKHSTNAIDLKALVAEDCDGMKSLIKAAIQEVLAVDLAPRESQSSWKDFLVRLKDRGLYGVEFVVSDDHAGLKKALTEVLTDAAGQRCYVHFLRNALDDLPRKADDDGLQELPWLYDRRDLGEVQRDLAAWLTK